MQYPVDSFWTTVLNKSQKSVSNGFLYALEAFVVTLEPLP